MQHVAIKLEKDTEEQKSVCVEAAVLKILGIVSNFYYSKYIILHSYF